MIEAHDIEKSFGQLKVLKGIDFTAGQSEVVSIMGASGAGKSTLLQILGTLMRPDKGTLMIGGTNVLNLGRDLDKRISSSTALDEAASLFLEMILEDPETYILSTQQGDMNQVGQNAYLYVYNGDLSSGSVATLALKDITEDETFNTGTLLKTMTSISVTHGNGKKGSVWVILVEYIDE